MVEMNSYEKWLASLLRAEVVCAELTQGGLSFEKINYIAQSAFKKSYRTDIDTLSISENSVELAVNRDGIYDRLPEGLFHQTRNNTRSNVAEMLAEHKRYKEEEKAARRFFSPFDQEFFRYGVMVEQEERKIGAHMKDEKMQQLLMDFWGLGKELPTHAVSVFISTLPWLSSIKGDLELTAQVLAAMLHTTVSGEELITTENFRSEDAFRLGASSLGMDMITGSELSVPLVVWKFNITGIPSKDIHLFTQGQPFDLFLTTFKDYFIPLDTDVVFEYETLFDQEQVMTEIALGYNLSL